MMLDRGQDPRSYNPGDDLVAVGSQFFADWSIQSQGWRGEMLCRAETMRVGSDSVVGYLRASSEKAHGVL